MKKIILILLFLGTIACENQPIEFPEYEFQAVYFPIQLPVRTLSLGEDRVDNTLDKEFKFDIGVSIGGMYKNDREWTVDYVVDESLADSVYISNQNLKILPLPSQYYTLSPKNKVMIPPGLFQGLIRVELTSAFFDDPLALTGQYVVPLKIVSTSADSILQGKAAILNGDPRVKSEWEPQKSPKDWVMYGVKYVNAYHGTYLHRGRDIRTAKETGVVHDTLIFRNPHVEKDALIRLTTIAKDKVSTNGAGFITSDDYSMVLTFENDENKSGKVTINPHDSASVLITGTGEYFDKASSKEQWSLLTWQSMYLNYTFEDDDYVHNISDTLVFRDRGIHWEENKITIAQ